MTRLTYIINDYLYSISYATGLSLGIVGLLVGIILLLFGFKLKKVALAIIGFLAGYVGGSYVSERFIEPGSFMYVLTPVLIGIVAAVVMFAVYYLAIYIMGFSIGGIAGFYLAAHLFTRPVWGLVIAVVLGLIIGSVALAVEKPVVVLGTSFIGYIALRQGLYTLLGMNESIVLEIVCLAVLLAGIVFQFFINKGTRREKDRTDQINAES